uniref:Nuclear migration protein nudC n=1 Tax=Cajanus cajan TaxID=3821 RepID=A0A151QRZ7_CAJCA|nr:Nuclear migration protein nudC [Cajanus cajan]KYP33035.1 Nuclear migration protein nudC [Cajanus cajan]
MTSPSSQPQTLSFSAKFDPSNPLEFLSKAFKLVAQRSNFLEKNTAEKEIVLAARTAKETVLNEKKDRQVKTTEEKKKVALAVVEKKDKEVETNEDKKKPQQNDGNGMDLENYSWQQTTTEIIIIPPVPAGMKSENIDLTIKENLLKIKFRGHSPIINGEPYAPLKSEDCFGCEDDHGTTYIILTKQQKGWWKSLMKGDPEIVISKLEHDYPVPDPETRGEMTRIMVID